MEDSSTPPNDALTLDQIVGAAVRNDRVLAGLTLAELSKLSSVSIPMISKIERGLVSASLSTLEALAKAIDVPVVNFFAGTVIRNDVSFVAAGEGVTVQRLGRDFGHSYKMIGRAEANHVSFESFAITLEQPLGARPLYQHRGIEFIHVNSGSMVYRCGEARYEMKPGDSLSFDSNVAHGPVELITDKVSFVTVVSRADPKSFS